MEKLSKKKISASDVQVGGGHYKVLGIQPIKFILAIKLSYCLGNVVKYICRDKGNEDDKVQDLLKAKHYIDLELETKYKRDSQGNKLIG